MAKVNRVFTPAVVKEVTPAQEVFHLELSAEEMALFYLLVGNTRFKGSYNLYIELKEALGFKQFDGNRATLSSENDTITVHQQDIDQILIKRQK